MSIRQWLALIGLTITTFVFNTSEFMPIGLLTDIAGSFGISEATTGIMISVYAWGVTILSLPLMILASRLEYKKLMLGVVALFAAGQLCSAAAPTFVMLVFARLLVACAHAIFWSIAAVMATRAAGPKHSAIALSMIATGSSIAMIFGMPIGRAIGLAVGWRMTFVVVGAIAAFALFYLAVIFPKLAAGEAFTLKRLPVLLKNRSLVVIYVITLLYAGGYYTGYSYIEPFLAQIGGIAPEVITVVLTLFGVAGLIGSFLFSRFYDGHHALFICGGCAGVALSLLAMHLAAASLVSVVALCIIWGICGTIYGVAFQAELLRCCDADDSAVAMSIYSGIFNLGIGSGSAIGGTVVSGISIVAVGYVGGIIAAVAALAAGLVFVPMVKKAHRTETAR